MELFSGWFHLQDISMLTACFCCHHWKLSIICFDSLHRKDRSTFLCTAMLASPKASSWLHTLHMYFLLHLILWRSTMVDVSLPCYKWWSFYSLAVLPPEFLCQNVKECCGGHVSALGCLILLDSPAWIYLTFVMDEVHFSSSTWSRGSTSW